MPNVQIIYEKIALFIDFAISSLQFIIIFLRFYAVNVYFYFGLQKKSVSQRGSLLFLISVGISCGKTGLPNARSKRF